MADDAGTDVGAWVGGAIGIFVIVSLLIWLLRQYLQGPTFKKNVRLDGKVVIITGCNAGIGFETALDLASRGGRIYMACRDHKKCEEARKEIIAQSGNQNVFNRTLDLSSLQSIREFVRSFLQEEQRLDILINNAGIITGNRTQTVDGFETQIGVNHMGHFLLTNLLLDILKRSAPSRIVVVSSTNHYMGTIQRDDLNSERVRYDGMTAYNQAKLANVLFVRELAKKLHGTGVTANSLHPGVINTEILKEKQVLKCIMAPFRVFFKTPKAGAQTTISVALDPDWQNVSGKYFTDSKIKKEGAKAQDDEMARWLWQTSEQWTGLLPDSVENKTAADEKVVEKLTETKKIL